MRCRAGLSIWGKFSGADPCRRQVRQHCVLDTGGSQHFAVRIIPGASVAPRAPASASAVAWPRGRDGPLHERSRGCSAARMGRTHGCQQSSSVLRSRAGRRRRFRPDPLSHGSRQRTSRSGFASAVQQRAGSEALFHSRGCGLAILLPGRPTASRSRCILCRGPCGRNAHLLQPTRCARLTCSSEILPVNTATTTSVTQSMRGRRELG
jgi:hypothetical protein